MNCHEFINEMQAMGFKDEKILNAMLLGYVFAYLEGDMSSLVQSEGEEQGRQGG